MESTPEEAAEGLAIVRVLAAVLDRLVCANTPAVITEPLQVTKFHALKAPGIGIQQYLERIHKYASCSNQCFIMALIYIDRLIQRNNFVLTELNVHRIIVTAILLAAKFFDDAYYNNAYYAKVGGVLVSEMNGLEVDFLFRINFSLHVTPELFEQYRVELLAHSGADCLPLPPPSPVHQYAVAEAAAMAQNLHPLEAQCLQQQTVMCDQVNGVNFPPPTGPLQAPQLAKVPNLITPSPRRPPSIPVQATSGRLSVKPVRDETMVHHPSLQSNLPNLFASQEFGYLQRANSLPVQTKSLVAQVQTAQSQPLSAPAMMAMVPGALNHHLPGLVSAATAAAAAAAVANDQLVLVDNQIYQLPGVHNGMHQHSGIMNSASDLVHHVHQPHHHHHVPGFVSREAAVAQQLVSGQMVAGVSGGL